MVGFWRRVNLIIQTLTTMLWSSLWFSGQTFLYIATICTTRPTPIQMTSYAFYYLHITTTAQSAYPTSHNKFSRYFPFKVINNIVICSQITSETVLLKFVIFSALWKSFNYYLLLFLCQKCLDQELARLLFCFAKVF